jgi:RNA polymerase sigma-70 factor (ECF subfamily)
LNACFDNDCELLDAIRNNNEQAFAELFKRYWRKVHAMTYARVRSQEVTEEIVQELFISLWTKRATLTIDNLPSYLYISVKNKVLNYIESQIIRQKHWNYYKQFIPQYSSTTDNKIELHELMKRLESAMQALPEKSQKVFRLRRLEGKSIQEIACLLNLSDKAIQYHLTRSLKKLRAQLKEYTPGTRALRVSRLA